MAEVDKNIRYFGKYLESHMTKDPDETKILYCFKKLDQLPVSLEHLQTTGIGKMVNYYRKHDGKMGDKARELVGKWKQLVPASTTQPSIQCETVSETVYDSSYVAPRLDMPAPSKQSPVLERSSGKSIPERPSTSETLSHEEVSSPIKSLECDKSSPDEQTTVESSATVSEKNTRKEYEQQSVKSSHRKSENASDIAVGKTNDTSCNISGSSDGLRVVGERSKAHSHHKKEHKKHSHRDKSESSHRKEKHSKEHHRGSSTHRHSHKSEHRDDRSKMVTNNVNIKEELNEKLFKENASSHGSDSERRPESRSSSSGKHKEKREKSKSSHHDRSSEKKDKNNKKENDAKVSDIGSKGKDGDLLYKKDLTGESRKEKPVPSSTNDASFKTISESVEPMEVEDQNSDKTAMKHELAHFLFPADDPISSDADAVDTVIPSGTVTDDSDFNNRQHLGKLKTHNIEKNKKLDHHKHDKHSKHKSKHKEKHRDKHRDESKAGMSSDTSTDHKHKNIDNDTKTETHLAKKKHIKTHSLSDSDDDQNIPSDHRGEGDGSREGSVDKSKDRHGKITDTCQLLSETDQHADHGSSKHSSNQLLSESRTHSNHKSDKKSHSDRKRRDERSKGEHRDKKHRKREEKVASTKVKPEINLDLKLSSQTGTTSNVHSPKSDKNVKSDDLTKHDLSGASNTSAVGLNSSKHGDDNKYLETHEKKHKPKDVDSKTQVSQKKKDKHAIKEKHSKSVSFSKTVDETMPDSDNEGLSFDDFLNFNVAPVKKHKKKKHDNTSNSNEDTIQKRDKSASRTGEFNKADKHKKRKSEGVDIPVPSKQVKLSEDDILSDLPDPKIDYKPLPHIKPVDSPSGKKGANVEFDDGLIGTKTHSRTQVYSGKRNVFLSAVPTLRESCLRCLMDNIDALDYVGGVPFDILEPVLERCNATQLYNIEQANISFITDSDHLWEKHCKRDFKTKIPDEFETWREIYLREHDARENRLKAITANISRSMAKAKPVRQTRLAYVENEVKPPRDVRRQQMKYGTAGPSKPMDPLTRRTYQAAGKHVPKVPPGNPVTERKFPTKAMAPMMAKTMKQLKNMRR